MWDIVRDLIVYLSKHSTDIRWQTRKAELIDGLPQKYANMLGILLENGRTDYNVRQDLLGPHHRLWGSKAWLQRFFCPSCHERAKTQYNLADMIAGITANVFPGLIAHHLVGVQPMVAGLSAIPVLRYVQEKGTPIKLEVKQAVVEARTRRLSARWSFSTKDATSVERLKRYGMTPDQMEQELIGAITQDIGVEIDQDLLRTLRGIPPAPTASNTFDQSLIGSQTTTVVDEFAALAVMIGRQANLIATRTRRNKANWVVVSPTALTILEAARASVFSRFADDMGPAYRLEPHSAKWCGILNKSMNVFCDPYADENTSILLGFKGESEVDAGAFYSPYVLMTTHGIVTDPNTFELVASFYTRYGWTELEQDETQFGCTADYLGLVGINAQTLSFL